MNLGQRIRYRRKQLRMSQQELAGDKWTRSYISQVELGKIKPPLDTLEELANRLDTPVADLLSDSLHLRAAKATVFTPRICSLFLRDLPVNPSTLVLSDLAQALQNHTTPNLEPPPSAELHYLTVRVLLLQEKYDLALDLIKRGLRYADRFWKIRLLLLQQRCAEKLGDDELQEKADEQLSRLLRDVGSLQDLQEELLDDLNVSGHTEISAERIDLLRSLDLYPELTELLSAIRRNH